MSSGLVHPSPKPLQILWLATKPPFPPVDGGRLVSQLTLEALASLGHRITLLAPVDPDADRDDLTAALAPFCEPRLIPVRPRARALDFARSLLLGVPYSLERHRHAALRHEAGRLLAAPQRGFDVLHVEQLQALSQLPRATLEGGEERGSADPAIPVILRAQNVESDLWRQAAATAGPIRRPLLGGQARLLARFEARGVGRVTAVVTLTEPDARHLARLSAGRSSPRVIPAPFPPRLPAALEPLPGNPPLVLFGSGGWLPNEDAVRWFVDEIWPQMRRKLPQSELHLFGTPPTPANGVRPHPPPADSRSVFAPNATLLVPIRIASGVRMRILESWARGVPVVATPAATAGLDVEHRRELLLAGDADEFIAAVRELERDPSLRARLRAAGHAYLDRHHRPSRIAEALVAVYRQSIAGATRHSAG